MCEPHYRAGKTVAVLAQRFRRSLVIGFLDPEDGLHDVFVAALADRQRDGLVVPASVYAEIFVAPYRAGSDAVAGRVVPF